MNKAIIQDIYSEWELLESKQRKQTFIYIAFQNLHIQLKLKFYQSFMKLIISDQQSIWQPMHQLIFEQYDIPSANKMKLWQIYCILLMEQLQQQISAYVEVSTLLKFAFFLAAYVIYRMVFNGATYRTKGVYNQKLRNIGKPLPSFPNGWYVAVHSNELPKGKVESVDIAGENLVVFRSQSGKAYALEAYCKHLGANLGIGGQVVNDKCVQCPFHGWLYDGQTGACVNHDGKPEQTFNVEYNEDFCQKGKKLDWVKGKENQAKLRRYPTCQVNGFVYVWIHALPEHQSKPLYPMLDVSSLTNTLQYRAKTVHDVMCHIQDIPENGSDVFHFKYVHSQVLPKIDFISFLWKAKWRRGDDPDIEEIFQHTHATAHKFKQMLWKEFIGPFPNKEFLSIGYIDNYLKLPFMGHLYMFNVTIVQLGCSTVFIFLKSSIFTIVFFHYIQPKGRAHQVVYHEGFTSSWIPYWISSLAIKMEGTQVTNDMFIWEAKKFGRNLHFKKDEEADSFLKQWREWYSQNYEGCLQKDRNSTGW